MLFIRRQLHETGLAFRIRVPLLYGTQVATMPRSPCRALSPAVSSLLAPQVLKDLVKREDRRSSDGSILAAFTNFQGPGTERKISNLVPVRPIGNWYDPVCQRKSSLLLLLFDQPSLITAIAFDRRLRVGMDKRDPPQKHKTLTTVLVCLGRNRHTRRLRVNRPARQPFRRANLGRDCN